MAGNSRPTHWDVFHQLAQGYAIAPAMLAERIEHLLPLLLLPNRSSIDLGRHLALRSLRLGLHGHFPLLTAEVLQL